MSNLPARAERACLLAAFWLPLAVCTYLALTPSPPQAAFRLGDVVVHALAFTYLTFALGLAYGGMRWPVVAGWMVAYGAFIEVAQGFGGERSAQWKDLLVDVGGVTAGLMLLAGLGAWSRRILRTVLRAVLP